MLDYYDSKNSDIAAFAPSFWDIDINDFDAEKHSAQLIQRVLECGELEDWKLVCSFYGLERIVSDCKSL